jgi:hypothetical protein
MTISGRAYRHTATHNIFSCSVDWLDAVMAKRRDGEKGPLVEVGVLRLDKFQERVYSLLLNKEVYMNSVFWRYQLLLGLLFIIWGEFFISGGILNQLAFNFALFYPLGFLAGYRHKYEDLRSAYLAAFSFNLLSYLIASIEGIVIESWTIVAVDFVSLIIIVKVGTIIGQRAQSKD